MYRVKLANILLNENDGCKIQTKRDLEYLSVNLLNRKVSSFKIMTEFEAEKILKAEYEEELENIKELI